MGTKSFWKQVLERAVKSAAGALLLVWGADGGFNVISVDVPEALGLAGGAALISVLMSIVSAGVGPSASPSLVEVEQAPR